MEFIFAALKFLLAAIWCFYLPGRFFSQRLKLKLGLFEDLFFSTVFGIILFTLITYIFAWFNLSILALVIVSIASFALLIKKEWPSFITKKGDLKIFLFLSILAIIFSLTMILSGEYGGTMRLIGSNGDGVWHLALINELKANFPPWHPGLSGVPFKGYHFFYDFLLSQVSKIFNISPIFLYFQFFPILTSFLWGFGVYSLVFNWTKSRLASFWVVFLTMFGGSFSFILFLQGHSKLSLDDGFGITQPATSLVNPPFAISIVIVTASLFLIHKILDKKTGSWLPPLVLLVGFASMFKVYAGMLLFGAFILLVLKQLKERKWIYLPAFFCACVIFLATYGVFANRSDTLIFAPLLIPHQVLKVNLPWYGYEEKAYTYQRLSVIRGMVEIELYALRVFILGSLGTRILGIFIAIIALIKERKNLSFFAFIIFSLALVSIIIPTFFIQSVQVFDIIQMAWYFLYFAALFGAIGFAFLFKSKLNRGLIAIIMGVILLTTLPSAYDKFSYYLNLSTGVYYDKPYYQSLLFLAKQESFNSIVLEMPQKDINSTDLEIKKWYNSRSLDQSLRITAFGNKQTYFDKEQDAFASIDLSSKRNFLKEILNFDATFQKDWDGKNLQQREALITQLKNDFNKNGIVFVYSYKPMESLETTGLMKKVFQNEAATIYKIN